MSAIDPGCVVRAVGGLAVPWSAEHHSRLPVGVGLHGVMADAERRRTREIGICITLLLAVSGIAAASPSSWWRPRGSRLFCAVPVQWGPVSIAGAALFPDCGWRTRKPDSGYASHHDPPDGCAPPGVTARAVVAESGANRGLVSRSVWRAPGVQRPIVSILPFTAQVIIAKW